MFKGPYLKKQVNQKQFSFSADPLIVLHIRVKFTNISQKLLFSMFNENRSLDFIETLRNGSNAVRGAAYGPILLF